MKKVLIAFDGTNYSEAAVNFARFLNDKAPIIAVGAFLPQTTLANLWSYAGGPRVSMGGIPLIEPETQEIINKNIERFENFCIDNGIEHRIHKDYLDFTVQELRRETRFADLLVLSSELFFADTGREPNDFLKQILRHAECPVILTPEKFEAPMTNVLAYDAQESSVFAIKQFSYLLPELTGNETILVCAKEDAGEPLPDEMNINELAGRHFPNLTTLQFAPDPRIYFPAWLMNRKSPILVTGAFGGSGTHRLFHKSFITEIIRGHKTPIFIAHN